MELLITFLAGASVMLGSVLVHLPDQRHRIENMSMALALGALLSLFLFDLLPELSEITEQSGKALTIVLIILGVVILKLIDRKIPEHRPISEPHHDEDHGNDFHIGLMSTLAIIIHNLVEGMTIYSMAQTDLYQGSVFALGIAFHNIPMGVLISASFLHRSRMEKAAVWSAITLSTVAGGGMMSLMSSYLTSSVTEVLLAIAAGMILYLIFMELIPHVVRSNNRKADLAGVVVGFAVVLVSTLFAG